MLQQIKQSIIHDITQLLTFRYTILYQHLGYSMKVGIAVLDEAQKQEIISKKINSGVTVQWVNSTDALLQVNDAEYWIDCTFSGSEIPFFERPTLLHAPSLTLALAPQDSTVGRFCAWNTFLKREVWEISVAPNTDATWVSAIMDSLGWQYLLVQDEPGFIAPRMLATIINEAYFALQAGVSTSEEID
ncbi:MAG: hypothetical protein EOP45_17050, partial [Sphingobacteriaceae bacterium]